MTKLIQLHTLRNSPANGRLLKVDAGTKEFVTPTYFPAISRKKMGDPDDKFVELVTSSGYPRLLISAYDYGPVRTRDQRKAVGRLSEYYRRESIIMLDSGVFEAYWRDNFRWNFRQYRSSIRNIDSDFFFSFDILPDSRTSIDSFRRLTKRSIFDSVALTDRSQCIPIIHGRSAMELLETVAGLVRNSAAEFATLAVSERELGQTLSDRGKSIGRLRQILDDQGGGLLHVLGCGNPISMAVYAYCGADTFDSIDWATGACDPTRDAIVDIPYFELLDCKCDVCKSPSSDYNTLVFLHNLLFYQNHSLKLQTMIKQRTLENYVQETTSKKFLGKLNRGA
jgi:queuine/archaeosine tRNA-ribosyltransferase